MVKIQLNEPVKKIFPKWKITPDVYAGVITDVSDIVQIPSYEGTETIPRIVFRIKLTDAELNAELLNSTELTDNLPADVELPRFVKPIVTKGSGTYANSELYNLLDKSGLMGQFAEFVEVASQQIDFASPEGEIEFAKWIKDNFINKNVKVNVGVTTAGTAKIKEIIKFV